MYTLLVIAHFFTSPINDNGMNKKGRFVYNNIVNARYVEYLYGVPVYLTLAQSALETGWGTSKVCIQNNNRFGIKKGDYDVDWKRTTKGGNKWRYYETPKESALDYGAYLKLRIKAKMPHINDWDGWCVWMGKSGYATSTSYTGKLRSVIGYNKWYLL